MSRRRGAAGAGESTTAVGQDAGSSLTRLARVVSSIGKILTGLLGVVLLVWLLCSVVVSFRNESVRVKPFEVSKSLVDAGFTGAALAENFREKVTNIEHSIRAWKARGGKTGLATVAIRGEEAVLGEVKVPGTDFSLERLSDLFLAVLQRPPIEVTGAFASTAAETIASIKTTGYPSEAFRLPTRQGCGLGCVDALVAKTAESFYYDRRPCGLELYYFTVDRSECEIAARRCVKSDPVFAYNVWGLFEMQRGNLHTAVEKFQHALALASRERSRSELNALIYNNWGILLTKVKDDRGAIDKYDSAIRSDSSCSRAYLNWGLALQRSGDARAAARMYRKAITAAPDLPGAYLSLGGLLLSHHRFKEAAAFFRRASAHVPRSVDIVFWQAFSSQRAGDWDEALSAYERVIDLDPRELRAYWEAAGLLRRCHQLRAAREELNRALVFAKPADQAHLRGELAELERELREHPEAPSLQVARCNGT